MGSKEELAGLLEASKACVAAMTREELNAMHEAQRQSFVRAMAPCEHGVRDFEDCTECRASALYDQEASE